MKVGGGLNYVTGPMGSGKSYYGVRRIVDAVTAGHYVVTNVELLPDAAERIGHHYSPFSKAKARRVADKVRGFYIFETELTEAIRYRLPGRGEARGLFVWDESHNDLNNRNWRERQKANANDRGTDNLLEWATQLRKLGFVGYLLSQHSDNTDAALRRVCNFQVRLQNQREQTRALGVRITPWPLFLALWYPTNVPLTVGRAPQPIKVERYMLGWYRHLYDTHGLYHGLDTDDESLGVVRLPDGGRRADAPAGARPTPTVEATPSTLPRARTASPGAGRPRGAVHPIYRPRTLHRAERQPPPAA